VKILALSTSTPRGSAALLDDGDHERVLSSVAYIDLKGHAERIFHAIDTLLADAGLSKSDLDAIACDIGPGSFTGVRVGVASAKGIALALAKPLLGVISLDAMALAAFEQKAAAPEDLVLAAIDAKKNEVFSATYQYTPPTLRPVLAPHADPFGPAAFAPDLPGRRLVLVGEIAAQLDPPTPFLARDPAFDLPDARWIARLARQKLAQGHQGDPALIEPLYVRPPDAKPQNERMG